MQAPWPHDRCVLCLDQRQLTLEHIIPRQLGGRLTARFLCKPCNDLLGHRVERDVRSDPSIRLAAENLAGEIPELATAIRDGQPYVGFGPGGESVGSFKGQEYQVRAESLSNGSVVHGSSNARRHLRRSLEKRGASAAEIEEKLTEFEKAPMGELSDLGRGVRAIRWGIDRIEPKLDGPTLSSAVLAKIAYEFVACHAGTAILQRSEGLSLVRRAVMGESDEALEIEYLATRKYRPLHGLALEHESHAVVKVCLFGWLLYRVHLLGVAVPRPHFVYTVRLDGGDEYLDELPGRDAS